MTTPALTPQEKTLKRVLAISGFDGWSIIVIAGLSFLLSLVFGELMGLFISLLILAAGVMELRGRRKLVRRDPEGMRLLVRSQLFLLTVILVYCARSIGSFDAGYLQDHVFPLVKELLMSFLGISLDEFMQQSGLTVADLVSLAHQAFLLLYGLVAFISTLYQGGMALYYRRKTPLVTAALTPPPTPVNFSVL